MGNSNEPNNSNNGSNDNTKNNEEKSGEEQNPNSNITPPSDMPSGNTPPSNTPPSNTPPSNTPPYNMGDMMNKNSSNVSGVYYILLSLEALSLSALITYLIMSNFNKKIWRKRLKMVIKYPYLF